MSTTLANVQDVERCHLVGCISQLLVVRLNEVAEEFAAERVDITTLTGDVETIGTCLAGFTASGSFLIRSNSCFLAAFGSLAFHVPAA